jgi:hypothetical protein
MLLDNRRMAQEVLTVLTLKGLRIHPGLCRAGQGGESATPV